MFPLNTFNNLCVFFLLIMIYIKFFIYELRMQK